MRRLATTLGALAFLWTAAATVYLLTETRYDGIGTGATMFESGVEAHRVTVPLLSANGLWIVFVLGAVTLLSGLPVGVALAYPSSQRTATWSVAVLLLGFAVVTLSSVGLFYVPSALLMVGSAAVTAFVRGDGVVRVRPAAERDAT